MRKKNAFLMGIALSGCLAFSGTYKGEISNVNADDSGNYESCETNFEETAEEEPELNSSEEMVTDEVTSGTDETAAVTDEVTSGVEETATVTDEVTSGIDETAPVTIEKNMPTESVIKETESDNVATTKELYGAANKPTMPYKENGNYYFADEYGNKVTKEGFVTSKDGYKYYVSDSSGKLATGYKTINGAKYHFESEDDSHPASLTLGCFLDEDKWYVADENGKIVTKTGWFHFNYSTKAIQEKSIAYYGYDYWVYVEDNSGKLKIGFQTDEKGNTFYLNPKIETGVFSDDSGKRYVADLNGYVVSGKGLKEVQISDREKEYYYLNEDGSLYYGWINIDGYDFYFKDEMARNGVGYWDVDYDFENHKQYYYYKCFDEKGHIVKDAYVAYHPNYANNKNELSIIGKDGYCLDGWFEYKGNKYFSNDGAVISNRVVRITDDGRLYYFWDTNTSEGTKYYFRPDGSLNKGWYKGYYSDSNGILQKDGWTTIDGTKYYFENGKVLSNDTYYFDENDKKVNKYDSYKYKYAFDSEGKIANGWVKHSDYIQYFVDGQEYTGWITEGNNKYYISNSIMIRNHEKYIDGVYYYFNEDGKAAKGWIKDNVHEIWYYLDEDFKGHNGWIGDYYIYNGKMLTDIVIYKHKTNDGTITYSFSESNAVAAYVLGKNGKIIKGKGVINRYNSGVGIPVLTDSKTGIAYQGKWVKENGKWYCYYYGVKLMSFLNNDNYFQERINGKLYIFNKDGSLATGWIKYEDVIYEAIENGGGGYIIKEDTRRYYSSSWYYADANGNLKNGWLKYNGAWYYFYNGMMMVNSYVSDDLKWYAGADGKCYVINAIKNKKGTGWTKVDGKWYYTVNGNLIRNEVRSINGKKYYFRPDGSMNIGWYHNVTSRGNHGWYYSDSNGVIHPDGWITSGGAKYYLENGHTLCNGTYYFDKNNKRVEKTSDYKTKYYFDSKGRVANGWVNNKDWFYYKNGQKFTGWVKSGNDYYYFNNSEMIKSSVNYEINGVKYGFKPDGKMAKGWYKHNSSWYYYDNNGSPYTGWQGDYFIEDGIMKTWSPIFKVKNLDGIISYKTSYNSFEDTVIAAYYLGADGKIIKGKKINNTGYTINYILTDEKTGLVDEVKWVKESGKWYCYRWGLSWDNTYDKKKYIIDIDDKEYGFNADGSLASGWFTDRSGNRCYAKSNVNPEKETNLYTGWITENGDKYYILEGRLLLNDYVPYSNGWYAGEDGKCRFIDFSQ